MNVKIKITGLDAAEKAAREILEHVEAIRQIQSGAAWNGIKVEAEMTNDEKPASGN